MTQLKLVLSIVSFVLCFNPAASARPGARVTYEELPELRAKISSRVGETGRVFRCRGQGCSAEIVTESGVGCRIVSPAILDCGGLEIGLLNEDGTTDG
jgi:hypothetical protein